MAWGGRPSITLKNTPFRKNLSLSHPSSSGLHCGGRSRMHSLLIVREVSASLVMGSEAKEI